MSNENEEKRAGLSDIAANSRSAYNAARRAGLSEPLAEIAQATAIGTIVADGVGSKRR